MTCHDITHLMSIQVILKVIFSASLQVSKLILIDASVFAEGTGNLAKLPRMVAYAGVRESEYMHDIHVMIVRLI